MLKKLLIACLTLAIAPLFLMGLLATMTSTIPVQARMPPKADEDHLLYLPLVAKSLITKSVVITNVMAISNVVYLGTAAFNEGDEYIDLFNQSSTLVNLSNWKVRVGQATYPLPTNLQIASKQGCRIYTNLFPSTDPPAPFNGCGGNFSFGISNPSPTGIYPNTGARIELLDSSSTVTAYFAY